MTKDNKACSLSGKNSSQSQPQPERESPLSGDQQTVKKSTAHKKAVGRNAG